MTAWRRPAAACEKAHEKQVRDQVGVFVKQLAAKRQTAARVQSMKLPKRVKRPLRKLEELLEKEQNQAVWPGGSTNEDAHRLPRVACERRDINGLREIRTALETGQEGSEPQLDEHGAARVAMLATLLTKIEYHLGMSMIEETRKWAIDKTG